MAFTFPAMTDHSWGRPGARAIKDAGYLGVMRYLGDPRNGRNIGKAELDSYIDEGLLVGFIWEGNADRTLSGYSGGYSDGQSSDYWLDQLGVPNDVTVIGTTVDFDANVTQLRGPIKDYALGFKDASRRLSLPYGSALSLDILCGELKLFPCGWQPVAWSRGRLSPYACMHQQFGYVLNDTSDHNNVIMMEVVQQIGWNPNVEQGPGPDDSPQEEDEMKSMLVHVDSRTSSRIRDLLGDDSEGFPNVLFQCFADFTMVQRLGEEEGKLNFYGVPTHVDDKGNVAFINGPEGDQNWWNLYSLRSRDFTGENLEP